MQGIKFFIAFFAVLGILSGIAALAGKTHQAAITGICIIAILVLGAELGRVTTNK